MASRRKKSTVPRTLPAKGVKKPKVRYGRGVAGLTPAKLQALLKAGWTPPEKKPPGRPKLDIDEKQVEKLAAQFHTQREIADLLGCSVDTISDRFSEAYWRGRATGKASLRRVQLKRAVKDGSDRMLIWMGKQELGQKDRHELSGDAEAPLVFEPIVPGSPFAAGAAPELPPGSATESR